MWTRGEDKLVELLVVRCFPRWNFVAARLLGKSPEQVSQRLERVVDEVTQLFQALEVDTPREWDAQQVGVAAPPPAAAAVPITVAEDAIPIGSSSAGEEAAVAEGKALVPMPADGEPSERVAEKKRKREGERKKAEKWTKEEHELFLKGLEIYGKGKWKVMSTEYLTTKTASQIASHYQKHCKRLEQRNRNGCKRASIHDITAPTTSAAAAAGGGAEQPISAQKDEEEEGGEGEAVGAAEECPGEDDLGTLLDRI